MKKIITAGVFSLLGLVSFAQTQDKVKTENKELPTCPAHPKGSADKSNVKPVAPTRKPIRRAMAAKQLELQPAEVKTK